MSSPDALLRQAQALLQQGQHARAIELLRSSVASPGADSKVFGLLAQALAETGRIDDAIAMADRARTLNPADIRPSLLLGSLLCIRRRFGDALPVLESALHQNPASPDAHLGLATALHGLGRLGACEASLRAADRARPGHAATQYNLGVVLRELGRASEAVPCFRAAAQADPRHRNAAREWASTLNYDPGASRTEIAMAHRAFAARVAPPGVPPARPAPDRRHTDTDVLRVGYLSGDLRTHSVAHFIEPILRHASPRMLVHVYSTGREPDETTGRLKSLANAWRDVAMLDDQQIARRIIDDRIDVLVELGGLTMTHRLGVLALRPAPVQVTYLGYPNTTGLDAVDYRVVDAITDPDDDLPGPETLVRLPGCFLCYQPPTIDVPMDPAPLRAEPGRITFASFNHIYKLNPETLATWGRLLREVPGSRLVMKSRGLDQPDVRRTILAHLGDVDPERVLIFDRVDPKAAHLAMYRACDIALDTYPYCGTTTTCEALWMGVPVVTRAGHTHASRVGASLLTALGLTGLITRDADSFVQTAAALAGDTAHLAALRDGLAAGFMASPLTDQGEFGRRFEQLLHDLAHRGPRSASQDRG